MTNEKQVTIIVAAEIRRRDERPLASSAAAFPTCLEPIPSENSKEV
ncbi:hypothetical protein [Paenibacillus baekrokdamisoli]|nr:hypothetical protein [Paenibacillus baekrokdamisoli]